MENSPSGHFTRREGETMLYLVEHFYDHCNTTFEYIQTSTLTLGFAQRKAQKATLLREQKCYI